MGYYNLRGFSFFGVGPRIVQETAGGVVNVMPFSLMAQNSFFGTIDISSPLFLPKDYGVKFSVFCDFGRLWNAPVSGSITNSSGFKEYIYDPNIIRVSIGGGIVWNSPMGEIRLDFAQAIVKGQYDIPMLFNLRMGQMKF
jgi:outer membrane protein insertion porin family